MIVQLLTHTPDPEQVVSAAARLCYSAAAIDQLLEKNRTDRDREALLRKILSLGHFSVLEHASFTFGIEGISRACSHQLVRHRLASYSQQSQRYVSHKERFDAVTPPSIAGRPELRKQYEACSTRSTASTGSCSMPESRPRTPVSCFPMPPRPRSW